MKKLKALLDFLQYTITAKIAFYRNVITRLTDNASFANPDIKLVDAKAVVDLMEANYMNAQDGSRTANAAMHAAESKADDLFRLLAAYVNRIADGDETLILQSGFNISKPSSTIQKPELSIQDGEKSGSVWFVARANEKAGAYIWQYAKGELPTSDEGWINAGHSTQASFLLTGLEPGGHYYFRVAAITPEGITDFTAAVAKIVI